LPVQAFFVLSFNTTFDANDFGKKNPMAWQKGANRKGLFCAVATTKE
jgi:hypothetical protein